MNNFFQNINSYRQDFAQEQGSTSLFINQYYTQLIEEQQQESADALFQQLL